MPIPRAGSLPLTDLQRISSETYEWLSEQDEHTVELADFTEMLRDDHDLTAAHIDQVLQYSVFIGWTTIWRDQDTGEMWISAVMDDASSEGSEGEGEVDHARLGS